MKKSTFFIGAFSLVVFSGISKKLHQTAVSDVMTENVEALARVKRHLDMPRLVAYMKTWLIVTVWL